MSGLPGASSATLAAGPTELTVTVTLVAVDTAATVRKQTLTDGFASMHPGVEVDDLLPLSANAISIEMLLAFLVLPQASIARGRNESM